MHLFKNCGERNFIPGYTYQNLFVTSEKMETSVLLKISEALIILPVNKETHGIKKLWSMLHKALCWVNCITIFTTFMQVIQFYIKQSSDQVSALICVSLFYIQKAALFSVLILKSEQIRDIFTDMSNCGINANKIVSLRAIVICAGSFLVFGSTSVYSIQQLLVSNDFKDKQIPLNLLTKLIYLLLTISNALTELSFTIFTIILGNFIINLTTEVEKLAKEIENISNSYAHCRGGDIVNNSKALEKVIRRLKNLLKILKKVNTVCGEYLLIFWFFPTSIIVAITHTLMVKVLYGDILMDENESDMVIKFQLQALLIALLVTCTRMWNFISLGSGLLAAVYILIPY